MNAQLLSGGSYKSSTSTFIDPIERDVVLAFESDTLRHCSVALYRHRVGEEAPTPNDLFSHTFCFVCCTTSMFFVEIEVVLGCQKEGNDPSIHPC